MTSLCCARNALPSSVVHWMSSAETLDDVGQRRHRLDAGVPRLLRDRVGQRLVLQARVLREPLLELDDLERVGGRHEDLPEERVRIEGDRCHQGVELLGGKLRLFRCRAACAVAGGAAWARNTVSPGASRAAQTIATRLRLARFGTLDRLVVRVMALRLLSCASAKASRNERDALQASKHIIPRSVNGRGRSRSPPVESSLLLRWRSTHREPLGQVLEMATVGFQCQPTRGNGAPCLDDRECSPGSAGPRWRNARSQTHGRHVPLHDSRRDRLGPDTLRARQLGANRNEHVRIHRTAGEDVRSHVSRVG